MGYFCFKKNCIAYSYRTTLTTKLLRDFAKTNFTNFLCLSFLEAKYHFLFLFTMAKVYYFAE